MTCVEAEPLIGASFDGELDPQTALSIDRHVSTCPTCLALLQGLGNLRAQIAEADLDWSAHADLRSLSASIRRVHRRPAWWQRPWLWTGAAGAIAVAVLMFVTLTGSGGSSVERQIADNHLRSLLAEHLVDVPSSDQHTVKPWFQGKLSFSPPVPDFSREGFSLVGGRLDVVNGKQAAALVYKRRQHLINVWIAPADGASRAIESGTVEGFHLIHWQRDHMLYWAASDLNAVELREFGELFRAE